MRQFRPGSFQCLISIFLLALPVALAGESIPLTVDATKTQQKILRVHEVIPVKPGPLTLYYPKWIPGEHGPNGPIGSVTGLKFEADGKTIPWLRDLKDVFTFHLEIPAGVSHLDARFDFIEPEGYSASDKLMVLEWNDVVLYPAGIPAQQQTYEAKLCCPMDGSSAHRLPIENQSGNEVSFKPISLDMLVDSPVIAGQYYRAIDITPAGRTDPSRTRHGCRQRSCAEHERGQPEGDGQSGCRIGQAIRHAPLSRLSFHAGSQRPCGSLRTGTSRVERQPAARARAARCPSSGMSLGGLLAHEFVHSWNGKFRRPADLDSAVL